MHACVLDGMGGTAAQHITCMPTNLRSRFITRKVANSGWRSMCRHVRLAWLPLLLSCSCSWGARCGPHSLAGLSHAPSLFNAWSLSNMHGGYQLALAVDIHNYLSTIFLALYICTCDCTLRWSCDIWGTYIYTHTYGACNRKSHGITQHNTIYLVLCSPSTTCLILSCQLLHTVLFSFY